MVTKNRTDGNTLYKTISSSLKEKITIGNLKAGQRLPTVAALAKEYSVSPVTALRAISHLKEQGLIKTTWGDGSYVSEREDSQIKNLVTLLVSGAFSEDTTIDSYWHRFQAQIAQGVQQECVSRGIRNNTVMIPLNISNSRDDLATYISGQVANVDGVLCLWEWFSPEVINALGEHFGRPLVFVNLCTTGLSNAFSSIIVDTYANAKCVLKHLLDLGHRRIACLTGPLSTSPAYSGRYQAYIDFLKDNCIEFDSNLVFETDEDHISIGRTCKSLLTRVLATNDPTAVFCYNDYRALLLKAHAIEMNIPIPSQLSIVGFDGVSQAIREGITTIEVPFSYLGREGVSLLVSILRGEIAAPIHKKIISAVRVGATTESLKHRVVSSKNS